MSKDLQKRAADMLLGGATLQSEPCPYCKGVRVIKDGHALCTSCGREPEKRDVPKAEAGDDLQQTLKEKIEALSKDLKAETDYKRQQEILQSINLMLETLKKAKQ